jgi:hypothetical protein
MRFLAAALALLCAGHQPAAHAQAPSPNLPSDVESVVSDVTVERNGDIEVVTTYTIRIDGHRATGLQLVIPLRGDPCANPPRFIAARVLSVTRNGAPEKWVIVRPPPEQRKPNVVQTGTKGVHLSDGEHVLAIRYRARGQIRVSGARDEIHWSFGSFTANVKSASARFRLPEPVDFEKISLFTGRYGAIGDGAHVVEQKAGFAVVAARGVLSPKVGIMAVLAWKKGVVNLPPPTEAEIAAAQKQQKQAKEFNCLTSSIKILNLAEVFPTDFSIWN